MRIKPRFQECRSCIHFTGCPSSTCLPCTAGEFFEEEVEPEEMSDEDLFAMIGYGDDE